jgi:cytoskeletal protein CcmA (bactofilin family)
MQRMKEVAMWKNGESHREQDMSINPAHSRDEGQLMAFVGKGVTVKGVISYEGSVKIDGCFEGEITTKGVLLVGPDAVVTAQVAAGTIVSQGKIIGDVNASERVSLIGRAVMNGSLKSPILAMEEGVLFTGQLEMSQKAVKTDEQADSPDRAMSPLSVSSKMKLVVD